MTPPQTTYTKRDEVLALRRGYADGVCGARAHVSPVIEPCESCKRVAAERYPLPKVERPRVVMIETKIGGALQLRVTREGMLQWTWPNRVEFHDWISVHHTATLRDLLNSPVELVDDPCVAGDD